MRKSMFLTILTFSTFCLGLFAESINGEYDGSIQPDNMTGWSSISWYKFSDNGYRIDTTVSKPWGDDIPVDLKMDNKYYEKGTYTIEKNNDLMYVKFNSVTKYALKKRLGILYSKRRLFLYDGDVIFFEPDETATWEGYSPKITAVRTSSSLKEGSVVYDGTQFIRVPGVKLQPWVEGKEGDGTGEWIEFDVKSEWNTEKLLIANGYISFNKPYLYRNNNRIKEYEITSPDLSEPVKGTLQDTPEIQEVVLPGMIKEKKYTMRLTIKSVYRGDKWNDTCLTLVYPMPPEPPSKYGEKY